MVVIAIAVVAVDVADADARHPRGVGSLSSDALSDDDGDGNFYCCSP